MHGLNCQQTVGKQESDSSMSTFGDLSDPSEPPTTNSVQIFNEDIEDPVVPLDPIDQPDSQELDTADVLPEETGIGCPILIGEECVSVREWRRENTRRLEEKERVEKELLDKIIEEADEYKVEFYRKREFTCDNNMTTNREREKVFLVDHERFHAEADNDYWKAIADLLPREIPALEKKGIKKEHEKKPGIVVLQGPKPGKPTELSRMRQILLNLKHDSPAHLKLSSSHVQDGEPSNVSLVTSHDPVAVV